MTASSHAGPGNEPWRARLDVGFQSEAWRAGEDNSEQYLQIDLGISHNITHVATQGSHVMNGSCWVTQYNLSYSLDGSSWEMYLENEVVKVKLTILFVSKSLTSCVFISFCTYQVGAGGQCYAAKCNKVSRNRWHFELKKLLHFTRAVENTLINSRFLPFACY